MSQAEQNEMLLHAIMARAGHIEMSQRAAARWVGGMARLNRLVREGKITTFDKVNKTAQNCTVRYNAREVLQNIFINQSIFKNNVQ